MDLNFLTDLKDEGNPPLLEVPYELKHIIKRSFFTGSRVICNPPVMTTDLDIVVQVHADKFIDELVYLGYMHCGSDKYPQGDFVALRKGGINLIVVFTDRKYDLWYAATVAATILNLTNKNDRIALFAAIHAIN